MPAALGDRSLFPDLAFPVYLNHAAVSPLSTPVRAAAQRVLDDFARLGVAAVPLWMEQRHALRERVAALLGATPADIGFPPGTTRGITDLALAIPWRKGDRILCFEGEFPSNVLPWQAVARAFGAEVVHLPLGDDAGLTALETALRGGGGRLVAVSTVQFQTGLRMPIPEMARLAHAHGAELFVDAIQALGALPVHVDDGFDYLVAGTHKWLMGTDGLAVAYAAPAARAGLRPLTAGWLSTEHAMDFLFHGEGLLRYDHAIRPSLDWMEGGVQATVPFAALGATLDLLEGLGIDRIAAHVQAWHDRAEPLLLTRGFVSARATDPAHRSSTLSLRPPCDLASLARGLGERGVSVATPDGWLRISPHWPNDPAQADALVDAVDDVLAEIL